MEHSSEIWDKNTSDAESVLSSPFSDLQELFPVRHSVNGFEMIQKLWQSHRDLVLVILAQFFKAFMAALARLLETDRPVEDAISPFQVIFMRQVITLALCLAYLRIAKTPEAPLGRRDVRMLLLARGFLGFFGTFGYYYSIRTLSTEEATVLTFVAPIVSSAACAILFGEAFPMVQRIAAFTSFVGVVVMSQPIGIGASQEHSGSTYTARVIALAFGLVAIFGFASAYTTIRWIGKRAHSVITVSYFSASAVLISGLALLLIPGIDFNLSVSRRDWALQVGVGCLSFLEQALLTAGLGGGGGAKTMNMVYSQVLFAALFDKAFWGIDLTVFGLVGSVIVVGSAVYAGTIKGPKVSADASETRQGSYNAQLLDELESQQGEMREIRINDSVDP